MRIIIALLLISINVQAQPINTLENFDSLSYSITSGKPYKVIDAYKKYYFYHEKTDCILSVKRSKHSVYLQKLNAKTLDCEYIIRYDDVLKKHTYLTTILVGDYAYFIYSRYDRKIKKRRYYQRKIDIATTTFQGEAREFLQTEKLLDIIISEDESKFMFYYQKDSMQDYHCVYACYNQNFDLLWEKEVDKDLLGGLLSGKLSNEGGGYKVFRDYGKETSPESRKPKIDNKISNFDLCIKDLNNNKTTHTLPLYQKFPNEMLMERALDSSWIAVANYGYKESGYLKESEGFVWYRFKEGDPKVKRTQWEYSKKFVNIYKYGNKEKHATYKISPTIYKFKPQAIIPYEDGSFLFVAEQYYKFSRTRDGITSSGRASTDIIFVLVNKDDEIESITRLPHEAGGPIDSPIGYLQHRIGDKLYISSFKYHKAFAYSSPEYFWLVYEYDLKTHKVSTIMDEIRSTSVPYNGKYRIPMYQFNVRRLIPVKDGIILEAYIKQKNDMLFKITFD